MARGRAGRKIVLGILAVVATIVVLFVVNGTSTAWRVPEQGRTGAALYTRSGGTLRVLAYNIAKCDAYAGLTFRDAAGIRTCLRDIAARIRAERADLVFLNEVVFECGPEPVNQVVELARMARLGAWLFGENYRWGLPFFRIRSGNAILSRFPLRGLEVQALPGQTPFYQPLGNRRLAWAEVELDGGRLLVGSVRNDSFDIDNNLVQVRAILRRLGRREALLAGDFNAGQATPPMKLLGESGRFSGELAGHGRPGPQPGLVAPPADPGEERPRGLRVPARHVRRRDPDRRRGGRRQRRGPRPLGRRARSLRRAPAAHAQGPRAPPRARRHRPPHRPRGLVGHQGQLQARSKRWSRRSTETTT